jgi:glycosyltransferase involved in cell wall biosynthesis/peptidoglycan/xylan/chitin deacetylase (PgdA/CDA1 family)
MMRLMSEYAASIIVPAYNVAPYIDECLGSLVGQSLPAIEILVFDDGSTDDTLARIRGYEERYPSKMRVITQANQGLSAVRNIGISQARGKYIGFVDGDDWVDPQMYEALYVSAEQFAADLAIGNGVLVDHATRAARPFADGEVWARLKATGSALIEPAQCPEVFMLDTSACRRLYNLQFLRRLDFHFAEGYLFEDVPAHYELLCNATRIVLIDQPFYNYRTGQPGRITARSGRQLLQIFAMMSRVMTTLRQFSAGPELWANFIWYQDWVLRWLGGQIDEEFSREFGRYACRIARDFPTSGIQRFREKFQSDQRCRVAVQLQLDGCGETYIRIVRRGAKGERCPSSQVPARIWARSTTQAAARECRVPILLYHSIADDGPAEFSPFRLSCAAFREQMRLLVDRGYYSVSLEAWGHSIAARRPLPGHPVVITFDDGYQDFHLNAAPILVENGMYATVFVVAGSVGGVNDWDGSWARELKLMGWQELRALQRLGFGIESHCVAHRDLTLLSDAEIAYDCKEARVTLSRELGREITAVAFPSGKENLRARYVLFENGYRIGVGTVGRLSTLADDIMNLPRIEIFSDDDLDLFALKVDLDID